MIVILIDVYLLTADKMPNRAYPKRADVAEKEAWSWFESVPPENITHEQLELAYRVSLNICKNCK